MNKDIFYQSIAVDMIADIDTYKRIYGYELSYPGYLVKVQDRLVEIGRIDVIKGYNEWYDQYVAKQHEMLKSVAPFVRKRIDEEYEREVKKYENEGKCKQGWKKKEDLLMKSRDNLMTLYLDLLKQGKVKNMQQFLTMAESDR